LRHLLESRLSALLSCLALGLVFALLPDSASAQSLPQDENFADSGGTFSNFQPNGPTSETTAFFSSLGTNGRTCETCHQPGDAFGLSISDITTTFNTTGGTDPLFAAVDGADCVDQPNSHNMLLNHGLIRVMLPIAPKTFAGNVPNFTVTVTNDPTNCQLNNPNVQAACVAQFGAGAQCISVYRRPLPATNLPFASVLMWDGRQPSPATRGLTAGINGVATNAVRVHEQGTKNPTSAQLSQISTFLAGLYTSQETDNNAGALNGNGATESAETMPSTPFSFGENEVSSTGTGGFPNFNSNVFTFFSAWSSLTGTDPVSLAQESIARGENIFNNTTFRAGPSPKDVSTCSACHNAFNVGTNSDNPVLFAHQGSDSPNDPTLQPGSYLPTFIVTCNGKTSGTATTDPGRALIDGNCGDVEKIKIPTLHGLLARPPFFHNGSAATLATLVKFYNNRENIGLTSQQQTDLTNFLGAL